MSVVGLTLGTAAKAIRPSAANAASVPTSATTRASGRARSYQAKPPASANARIAKAASCQLIPRTSRFAAGPRCDQRGVPCSGVSAAARAAEDPGGLGDEVAAPGQHLGRRAVGDQCASASSTTRCGEARPRTRGRGWRRAPRRRVPPSSASSSRLWSRSIPRVGSSRHSTAGGESLGCRARRPAPAAASPRLTAHAGGARRTRAAEPTGASAAAGASWATRLVDQIVARVLDQQRRLGPRPARSRGSASSARPRGAAASTCRRRFDPSARPARRARAQSDTRAASPARIAARARRRGTRNAGAASRRFRRGRSPASGGSVRNRRTVPPISLRPEVREQPAARGAPPAPA